MLAIASALASTIMPLIPGPASAAELRVTIDGIRSTAGAIMLGLYDSPAGFRSAIDNAATAGLLNDKGRLVGISFRPKTRSQSFAFFDLPPGVYAIIVYHDENDNGRLDENLIGVPTEGYGFSNNPQGLLGAPSFQTAAVAFSDSNVIVTISLIYRRRQQEVPGRN